ncbi:class I SAM-dependent DNA methyltransferase [Halobaculum sp. D14]|uniref:class I SAM-dependent DNA methyltransferase n=1 Tax=unclassified Halobaculum TaxID=2640896 RepID=UPI003EBA991E
MSDDRTDFTELYASAYDEMYREKDYEGEVSYLEALWSDLDAAPASVLELGCGTCGHGLVLAERGYDVLGVDRSAEMVERAREKVAQANQADSLSVQHGDLASFDADEPFDAAIAMFAVMGYVAETDALREALETVRRNLSPGGTFIFDTWYGPAVLDEGPETRLREIETDTGVLYRYATPTLDTARQVVTVEYDLVHVDEDDHATVDEEAHEMRFFFQQEMELLTEMTGFDLVGVHPFRDREADLGTGTWNVTWVLEKNA